MKKTLTSLIVGAGLIGAVAPAQAWHHGHYYHGDAVAAGVAGLAAGALIGGAIASQRPAPPPPATIDPQLAAWCARKYRSFDPATGTFLSRSGERLICTY